MCNKNKDAMDLTTRTVEDVVQTVTGAATICVDAVKPEYSQLLKFLKEEMCKNPEVVAKDLLELLPQTSCVPCTFLQSLLPFLSKKVASPK